MVAEPGSIAALQGAMRLESPKPAFSPLEGRPALSWSRMELLSYLDLRGWECHYLAGPDEQGSVLNLDLGFRRSDDKCIYIVQGRLLHHYLCCLSFIDAALPLRLQDGATEFRHFESEPYYARRRSRQRPECAGMRLLSGEASGSPTGLGLQPKSPHIWCCAATTRVLM